MPRGIPNNPKKAKKSWPKWPSKMTEDAISKLEAIFKIDGTVAEACAYANITHTTYHDRYKKDEEFSYRMDKAKEYMYVLARKTLAKWVQDGDVKAAIEFLKRRDKRYKDKTEVDGTVKFNPTSITIT